jgi:protein-export membrane protein SecD
VLHVSGWTKWLTLTVIAVGMLVALPNALNDRMRARLPSWLPHEAVNYGLDLQGGSSLLLEVDMPDVQKSKAEAMLNDITAGLRKANIGFRDPQSDNDSASVTITDTGRYAEAKALIQTLNPMMATTSLTTTNRQYALSEPGNYKIVLQQTAAYVQFTQQQVLEQSREVVNRRIDALGTREPTVLPQPPNRIVVEVPGLSDPSRLKALLGATAKMTFRLVDENADPSVRTPPVGDDILDVMDPRAPKGAPLQKIVVHRRVMVDGEHLTDAQPAFDQQTGQPVINLRFDSVGARQFGDVTKANLQHRFAIVLDSQVIMAPTIQVPILNGLAQISNIGTSQEASDLSILLRSGSLPAKVNIIEERTVGAELGQDSINAGRVSAIAGLALVALFMVLRYGLFGLFADLALTLNLILLLAALTPLATLTLPGIAGIVLTLGMAVDANVLIFERIREEQRNGRGMLGAIDAGFKRAMATIFDANMTHLIAAMILFMLGQGPVKGFAVALFLGIATSFFTSVVVTRLIVITWLNIARPRTLTV